MKGTTLAVVLVLLACAGLGKTCNNNNWDSFKNEFNKKYKSAQEEANRRAIFCRNLDMIDGHNKRYKRGEVTFEMGINQFADWTQVEFRQWLIGGKDGVIYGESWTYM